MNSRLFLLAFGALALGSAARAEECPVTGADATTETLSAAPTCREAAALYGKCTWGSSIDVQFAAIVVEKCRGEFLAKLTSQRRVAYQRQHEKCTRKYRNRDGTLYRSLAASCTVNVADDFAKRVSKLKAK
jgi:hypothetical protein